MAYSVVPTIVTNDVATAAWGNQYIKDNLAAVLSSSTTLNTAIVTSSLTQLGTMVTYGAGAAVTAGNYQAGRDADGTNQLHFNVPTGAGFEFSINDVAEIVHTTGAWAFQLATTISTTAGDLTLAPNGTDVIVPDSTAFSVGAEADSRIYYNGTDTFWDLRAVGTGSLMMALGGSFPSPDSTSVHIWKGSAGVIAADSVALLVLENNGATGIQFLSANTNVADISFGDDGSAVAGRIRYDHGSVIADGFRIFTAATEQLRISDGSFAFQKATTLDLLGGLVQLTERTAPGAGAANTVRIYAVVDGGSLTDLAAVFQDGTVDLFAQEV